MSTEYKVFKDDMESGRPLVVTPYPSPHGGREVHISGTGTMFRNPATLREVGRHLASLALWLEGTESAVPVDQSTWDRAWEVIAEARDRYPREPNDQPTDEIVNALAAAGLLADHPPMPATAHAPERTDLPPTADEQAALTAAGFDLDEEYPEYGQASLIKAFRAGPQAGGASR